MKAMDIDRLRAHDRHLEDSNALKSRERIIMKNKGKKREVTASGARRGSGRSLQKKGRKHEKETGGRARR